jgi:nucleotide-binding universal stress UspA family protein
MAGTRDPNSIPRVVVGVDGSPEADAALREAVVEAALRQAELDVVHVWTPPYSVGPIGAMAVPVDVEACEEAADQVLERSIERNLRPGEPQPKQIERILVRDHSVARRLVEIAKGADLLVVGSRGHGGFTGLLLGSVSQQCVHHAPCPVMVVHPPAG